MEVTMQLSTGQTGLQVSSPLPSAPGHLSPWTQVLGVHILFPFLAVKLLKRADPPAPAPMCLTISVVLCTHNPQ